MSRRVESIANMAVIGVALLVGFVLLRREFQPRSQPVPPPPPSAALEYFPDWKVIEASGLALDSSSSAPLRVMIFTDMECSFCAKLHLLTLPELRKQFGDTFAVTLVHTPIRSHRFARQSAIAVECAADQKKHREMVDAVYEKQDSIGLRTWKDYATDAEIHDLESFSRCMRVDSSPRIDAGLKWAEEIALRFTPTVMVNGWRFPSAPQTRDFVPVFRAILAGHDPSQTDAKKDERASAPQ